MNKMSQIPHELIRQVQISTRAVANLSDYDLSDPTLPELPSLASEIAASDLSPHLRCENCKGGLLRGPESIICLYCGRPPNYDALPEPISFTSSIGYKWLLRSLGLDGSELVDPRNNSEQYQGQSSSKASTPLSDFLNFKIHWPADTEQQETRISHNLSKQSRSFSLTGADPVKFFSRLNRDVTSDPSIKQPSEQNNIGTVDKKSIEAPDHQDLFQNVPSSEPVSNSSQRESTEDFSGWEADFQFAGSQNQESSHKSSEHFADFSGNSGTAFQVSKSMGYSGGSEIDDSGNNFQVSKSMDLSMGSEVDLAAQIDSVFGPVNNINDGKPKENPVAYPEFDDLWDNLSSIKSHSASGFDATDSTKDTHVDGRMLNLSASADLLQDFQLQPNYADMPMNKTTNEEQKEMDLDTFGEWNEFTSFSSLQGPSETGSEYQFSTSDKKFPEIDLFNFDNTFEEGGFGSFSQPNLFSASNGNSDSVPEVNTIMSGNPASIRSSDTTISASSDTSGQPADNGDTVDLSTKDDDVKMLISEMHDLSFMLETDLSVPTGSGMHNSPLKD